jgi:hypothetical protein
MQGTPREDWRQYRFSGMIDAVFIPAKKTVSGKIILRREKSGGKAQTLPISLAG